MRQLVKKDKHVTTFATAHASSSGVAMVLHDYTGGEQRVKTVSIFNKRVKSTVIWPDKFFKVLNEELMDCAKIPLEERGHGLDTYRQLGATSNVNELAAEGIGYLITGSDVPFSDEIIDFSTCDETDKRKAKFPGELRGFKEVSTGRSNEDILEPLATDEALSFITLIFSDTDVTPDEVTNPTNVAMWLKPELERALYRLEEVIMAAREKGITESTVLAHIKIDRHLWSRIKRSVKNSDTGDSWSECNAFCIGSREGTTEDESRQNDKKYTTHEQYHTIGELVDGRYVFSEEMRLAEQKNMLVVSSMYYLGVEKKKDKSLSHKGENRGWQDRSVYYLRCAATRNELFADKLWRVLTWPLDMVERGMKVLKAEYATSVKENSEGPKKRTTKGAWETTPMVGKAAINHIKRTGVGTLKGRLPHKNINVTVGQSWHKLMLKKEHLDALDEALMWRRGEILLNVEGTLVKEKFEQKYQGLPRQYVLDTYAKR